MKEWQISYTNQLNKKLEKREAIHTSTDNIWLRAFAGKQLISKCIRFLFRALVLTSVKKM